MSLCHSHQNALVEASAVVQAGDKLVNDFFSFTHFVQASTQPLPAGGARRVSLLEDSGNEENHPISIDTGWVAGAAGIDVGGVAGPISIDTGQSLNLRHVGFRV